MDSVVLVFLSMNVWRLSLLKEIFTVGGKKNAQRLVLGLRLSITVENIVLGTPVDILAPTS